MNDPILCTGNDLKAVLDDLDARGMFPNAVDAMFGGKNAGYRVSYFERGDTPVNHFGVGKAIALKTPSGAEDSAQTNEGKARRTHLQDRPDANFAGEAGSTPVGCETTKAAEVQPSLTVGASVVAMEHAGNLSIESRMAALQERLAARGKLRRSQPATQTKHVRLPYSD